MKTSHLLFTLALVAGHYFSNASGVSAQDVHLFAVLSGGNEVSSNGDANAGDQNGHGASAVTFRGERLRTLCIGTVVNGIAKPTLMHIHQQRAGQNGPIVVPLDPPASGNPGTRGQCVNITADLSEAIRANPSDFYVNIHNGDFPGGAVRGQLF
jgi:hypothetical protein